MNICRLQCLPRRWRQKRRSWNVRKRRRIGGPPKTSRWITRNGAHTYGAKVHAIQKTQEILGDSKGLDCEGKQRTRHSMLLQLRQKGSPGHLNWLSSFYEGEGQARQQGEDEEQQEWVRTFNYSRSLHQHQQQRISWWREIIERKFHRQSRLAQGLQCGSISRATTISERIWWIMICSTNVLIITRQ